MEKHMIMFEELGGFLQVVGWRRELHRHPELAYSEHKTQAFIASVLNDCGINFRQVAGTGILAEVVGEKPNGEGGTILFRADIDALPIEERSDCEFASQTVGVMHACGHDMHTAMLLGMLNIINHHRQLFSGRVLGLFQPAEEVNPGGASMILNEGVLDEYTDIKAVIGAHIDPNMPTGSFGFRAEQYMASSDELRFHIKGVGGHAALRQAIKDPIRAGAYLSSTLYDLPNQIDSAHTLISLGQIEAQGATNIVPDNLYMAGTMRTFNEEHRKELKRLILETAARIDAENGTTTNINFGEGYPSVYNNPALTERIKRKTIELLGEDNVYDLDLRLTSDDFGHFSQRYPSLYYRIGVGGRGEFFEQRMAGNVHSSKFNPDEKALTYGTVEHCMIVFELMQ